MTELPMAQSGKGLETYQQTRRRSNENVFAKLGASLGGPAMDSKEIQERLRHKLENPHDPWPAGLEDLALLDIYERLEKVEKASQGAADYIRRKTTRY